MKSYAKKIMTRLAAGAMALLLAVGTAATDMFGQPERDSYDR